MNHFLPPAMILTGPLMCLVSLVHAQEVSAQETESTAQAPAAEDDDSADESPVIHPTESAPQSQGEDRSIPRRVVVRPGQTINGFTLEALAKRGVTWDLTPSAGLRLWRSNSDNDATHLATARLRAGVLLYHQPSFLMLGVSAVVGGVAEGFALGGEVEVAQSERGVWLQGGVYTDRDGIFGSASVGYTLFGVEYQRRLSGDAEGRSALFLSLHIPISIIRVALQPPTVQAR